MFGLLAQTAMGVWLSTLISAAVTAATPIITDTVKPAAPLHSARRYLRPSVSPPLCSHSGSSISASHNRFTCMGTSPHFYYFFYMSRWGTGAIWQRYGVVRGLDALSFSCQPRWMCTLVRVCSHCARSCWRDEFKVGLCLCCCTFFFGSAFDITLFWLWFW